MTPIGQGAPAERRLVDRGAIFAGWVGLGMSVMVVIGLELIVTFQTLVFLWAPIGGLLVGAYAGARSSRRRPWRRVLANSVYAGLITGVSLAVLYGLVRLLFIYADSGYGGGPGGGQLGCRTGPACTYQRYLTHGQDPFGNDVGADLRAAGVTDAASFEGYVLRGQLNVALVLAGSTLLGAIAGGVIYAASGPRRAAEAAAVPG